MKKGAKQMKSYHFTLFELIDSIVIENPCPGVHIQCRKQNNRIDIIVTTIMRDDNILSLPPTMITTGDRPLRKINV